MCAYVCFSGIADANISSSWKKQRQFWLTSLMKLGVGRELFETQVREESERMVETFSYVDGEKVDFSEYISLSVLNVIHFIMFGQR